MSRVYVLHDERAVLAQETVTAFQNAVATRNPRSNLDRWKIHASNVRWQVNHESKADELHRLIESHITLCMPAGASLIRTARFTVLMARTGTLSMKGIVGRALIIIVVGAA